MLLALRGTGRTPGVVDHVIHGTIVIEGYIDYKNKKTKKNVTRCRDDMPKSMQTR